MISISVVSHGQGILLLSLLSDLAAIAEHSLFEVLLTKNIPEHLPFSVEDYPFELTIFENNQPKGFGANHNAAFRYASGEHFCVLNPDVRIISDPFPQLLAVSSNERVGVVAPLITSPNGAVEASARRFPTPINIFTKLLGIHDGRYPMSSGERCIPVDWVGGMFMLLRAEVYERVNGFDEGFFLYYEDVDICARIGISGLQVMYVNDVVVIHDARRDSHRKLLYLSWHIGSMLRFFIKFRAGLSLRLRLK